MINYKKPLESFGLGESAVPMNISNDDDLDATVYDDAVLPPECRSTDMFKGIDMWELLGRE